MRDPQSASRSASQFISSDEIRSRFSRAMSAMYRHEVPQYGALLELVSDLNAVALQKDPGLQEQLCQSGQLVRLGVERHGAIRLGTGGELSMMRRIFSVMGMLPVGYYDLSMAGVPVHATAFRPIDAAALATNPFRLFTSLLRLELIDDIDLRSEVARLLAARQIVTPRALELTQQCESMGGLTAEDADAFVIEVLETFRWQSEARVDIATYRRLHRAHRLIADVACFKGPHINHLTPRTLDIDAAQAEMSRRGMAAKEVIEGPPRRNCPILLRQTSFKALEERIGFVGADADAVGTHTARFGEIEQRGMALTRKGRTLYDRLLAEVHDCAPADGDDGGNRSHGERPAHDLAHVFRHFPDDEAILREQGLAFFRYALTDAGLKAAGSLPATVDLNDLLARKLVRADPITYEDFLPVSAAGIFQSNLDGVQQHVQKHTQQQRHAPNDARAAFEAALGSPVHDEIALYEKMESESIAHVQSQMRGEHHAR
jgi:uncharacterized glyoxalase superfamily metalloenzyme YdcJ